MQIKKSIFVSVFVIDFQHCTGHLRCCIEVAVIDEKVNAFLKLDADSLNSFRLSLRMLRKWEKRMVTVLLTKPSPNQMSLSMKMTSGLYTQCLGL